MKIVTLVLATFRELLSKTTLYVLLGISTLIMIGTLASVSAEHVQGGVVLKVFGNLTGEPVPESDFATLVYGMQAGLAKGLFFGIMLFGVFSTAAIVPETLERGTVDLFLSKPLARWELLLGKYLGAVAVMLTVVLYFIGGIWLGFGARTGVWNGQFLLSSFVISFMFGCIFSIVLFLGVVFRNAAVPIIGSFLYLVLIDNALDSREMTLYLISDNPLYRTLLDGLYYALPQIAGMQRGLNSLIVHETIVWHPFAQGFLSAAGLFAAAAAIIYRKDF